jgi:hypothetical protein
MQKIIDSPGLFKQMGLRGRSAVTDRFEQEAQIDQLESFYEEAIIANGAAEPSKSKRLAELSPPFAEQVPAK